MNEETTKSLVNLAADSILATNTFVVLAVIVFLVVLTVLWK